MIFKSCYLQFLLILIDKQKNVCYNTNDGWQKCFTDAAFLGIADVPGTACARAVFLSCDAKRYKYFKNILTFVLRYVKMLE